MAGSAITAPFGDGQRGVLGVQQVIQLIKNEFNEPGQLTELEGTLLASDNRYQAAFRYLIGRRGPAATSDIIKRAVWNARKSLTSIEGEANYRPSASTPDEACRALDADIEGWELPPAVSAIGTLAADYPDRFGAVVLTTNFDPLIEVAITRSGGQHLRTVLHRDGNLSQTSGNGCHVVHLHGYWHGSDTLHTPRQLLQARPRLRASLATAIDARVLVVIGYGGWDDVFSAALMDVLLDDNRFPEVVWAFYDQEPVVPTALYERLAPGIDRGRVTLYSGIDCHEFLPALAARWNAIEPPPTRVRGGPTAKKMFVLRPDLPDRTANRGKRGRRRPEGQDRPPLIDVYVGRSDEFQLLTTSDFKVAVLTGIGGQGKSALAAKYFNARERSNAESDLCIWRDCKEESGRFENQVIAMIEHLTDYDLFDRNVSRLPADQLVALLLQVCGSRRLLFVFDNIDFYIDIELERFVGVPQSLVIGLLSSESNVKAIFTCRPNVRTLGVGMISRRLSGLDLDSTIDLFKLRGAAATHAEIQEAHTLAGGHAFWLDLLAAQVARRANVSLSDLLHPLSSSSAEIPVKTLQSIWSTLREREQLVLRALAETMRPTTEERLAEYLEGKVRFNHVVKALRYLRGLNLIVIKPFESTGDAIELHPVVREFVRRTFPRDERISFIDAIVNVYKIFFGRNKAAALRRPSLATLQNWTEAAELHVEAGRYEEAFALLYDIRKAFADSEYPAEFARVAEVLFSRIEWGTASKFPHFDGVAFGFISILVNLRRIDDARRLLASLRETIGGKDARYIMYCDSNCHLEWTIKSFSEAIRWGLEGKKLVDKGGLDAPINIEHNLALARRDSGDIDRALEFFLRDRSIEEVIDNEEFNEQLGGAYYGNIGRCLHLMGQIEPALTCYQKSAILIERSDPPEVENEGYIRQWIGELLIARGEPCVGGHFFNAALQRWDAVSPLRASQLKEAMEKSKAVLEGCEAFPGDKAERFCVAWIYGREAEFA